MQLRISNIYDIQLCVRHLGRGKTRLVRWQSSDLCRVWIGLDSRIGLDWIARSRSRLVCQNGLRYRPRTGQHFRCLTVAILAQVTASQWGGQPAVSRSLGHEFDSARLSGELFSGCSRGFSAEEYIPIRTSTPKTELKVDARASRSHASNGGQWGGRT